LLKGWMEVRKEVSGATYVNCRRGLKKMVGCGAQKGKGKRDYFGVWEKKLRSRGEKRNLTVCLG